MRYKYEKIDGDDPIPVKKYCIEISEYEGGEISVQELRPDGLLSEVYGNYLYGSVLDKLGAMLMSRDVFVPEEHFDSERTDLEHADTALLRLSVSTSDNETVQEKPSRAGFIYILRGVGTDYYKIGMTAKKVSERLAQISPKLPFEVTLTHYFPADDVIAAEAKLHEMYQSYRKNGEWFILSGSSLSRINAVTHYEDGEFQTFRPGWGDR